MSQNETVYSDLTTLLHSAEEVGEVETNDFSEFLLLDPGIYENPSREIKAKQENGKFTGTFEITFTGGLFKDGMPIGGKNERTWVSTRLYERQGHPGKTSSVAEYLKKCGFAAKGLGGQELVELMIQSQNVPVGVGVKWTNRTEKLADGSYEKESLKTKDFNVGSKDEPIYVPEVEINGRKFQARHRVGYFASLT
jgi:hypothetical protein